MNDMIPVYVLAPPGPSRDALISSAGGEAKPLETSSLGEGGTSLTPGLVLADVASVPLPEIVDLLRKVSASPHGWMVALLEHDSGEDRVRVLSLAPATTLQEAIQAARDPSASPGTLLELQRVLTEVARVRHDLNNPLTSALAEVQLALMDVEGPDQAEMRESLEAVQAQLRRIRDLLASTRHLRPTRG